LQRLRVAVTTAKTPDGAGILGMARLLLPICARNVEMSRGK
jgi:hypothetical protein